MAAAGDGSSLARPSFIRVSSPRIPHPSEVATRAPSVDYSAAYYRRLDIHRKASTLTIPLFALQMIAGAQLFEKSVDAPEWAKVGHRIGATGVAALFATNLVTGVPNYGCGIQGPERPRASSLSRLADVGRLCRVYGDRLDLGARGGGSRCAEHGSHDCVLVDGGGSRPVAVTRTGAETFVAMSMVCPHAGYRPIQIAPPGFKCPNHGAEFESDGTWVGGQRTRDLTRFAVVYDAAAGTLTIS
jgi:nitrite reductase/ring-hydroxylating ferredoxin subunit